MSFSNLPRPAIPDDEVPVLLAIPDDEVPVLPRVGHGHGAPHVVGGGVQQVHHVVLDTRPPVILWWSPAHRTYSTLHYCTAWQSWARDIFVTLCDNGNATNVWGLPGHA